MPRWIQTLLAIILGTIAGLFYGWKIAPVKYVNLAPNTLRADYRAEYMLTVAEAYQHNPDPDFLLRQLALLGNAPPAEIIQENLDNGEYTPEEIELLEELLRKIERWEPTLTEPSS